MKKISLMLAAVMIMSLVSQLSVSALTFTPNTTIYSEAAYLINTDTGTLIYEKNSKEKMYPASLTKIMTAILVLENIDDLENTQIEAPSYIFDELYGLGASTADFRPYETATADELMYGLMLQSACEAGSILADYVGGSVENFVLMMNDKAKELGCTNTNFVNAHGLHDPNQYTTAEDMAKIMAYAQTVPNFEKIAGTYSFEIGASNKHTEPRTVYNTNKMLLKSSDYYYEPIKAGKTGTTDEAGRCLATTASLDGYNYLLVVMGGPLLDEEGNTFQSAFVDSKTLYEWAFTYFKPTTLLSTTEEMGEVAVNYSDGNEFVIVYPAEEYSALWPTSIDATAIERKTILPESIDAPVVRGQKVGTLELKCSGETLATVDLLAGSDVERSAWKYNLEVAKNFLKSPWLIAALVIIGVLIVGYIVIYITVNRKKRRAMKRINKRRKF